VWQRPVPRLWFGRGGRSLLIVGDDDTGQLMLELWRHMCGLDHGSNICSVHRRLDAVNRFGLGLERSCRQRWAGSVGPLWEGVGELLHPVEIDAVVAGEESVEGVRRGHAHAGRVVALGQSQGDA